MKYDGVCNRGKYRITYEKSIRSRSNIYYIYCTILYNIDTYSIKSHISPNNALNMLRSTYIDI